MEAMGVTHAQVGAYLLSLWGLPPTVVEAVAEHHTPERGAAHSFSAITAVHVADILAHQFHPTDLPSPKMPQDYLESLGVANRLSRWREMAHQAPEELLGNGSSMMGDGPMMGGGRMMDDGLPTEPISPRSETFGDREERRKEGRDE